ncbi:YmfQ family protein [Bacillus chungangensis]|uniref:DUF2313 domain-containing protein n=1 Tax=Bacillus chungangensis TaxID=587633 RepID=A0ABT9WM55_9BACI|nr:YmfQ family protein [Bacillus chungangensis]MDQ0174369.1 hypothetical protein [Bacillus chungangensis]
MISQTKRNLHEYMPPYYDHSPELTALTDIASAEIDRIRALMRDTLDQMFVRTATWGLSDWERVLDLPPMKHASLDARRERILAKLNGNAPATVRYMTDILNLFVENKTGQIIEHNEEYWFEVLMPIESLNRLAEIKNALSEVKPAHLEAIFIGEFYAILLSFIDNTYDFHVQYPICGDMPPSEAHVSIEEDEMRVTEGSYDFSVEYEVSETKVSSLKKEKTVSIDQTYDFAVEYPICGEMQPPQAQVKNSHFRSITKDNSYTVNVTYPICGDFYCGEEIS